MKERKYALRKIGKAVVSVAIATLITVISVQEPITISAQEIAIEETLKDAIKEAIENEEAYIVVSGDTLSHITQAVNDFYELTDQDDKIHFEEIAAANDIKDPDIIYVGQELLVHLEAIRPEGTVREDLPTYSEGVETTPAEEDTVIVDKDDTVTETNPVDEDEKPVDEDTDPVDENEKPVDEDTDPVDEDEKPVDEDTDPVDENEKPVDEDTDPVDENEKPVDEDTDPVDEDKEPVDEETDPVDEDKEPVDEDTDPVDEDKEPVDEDTDPVDEDKEPVDEDTDPVDEDKEPVDEDTDPVDEDKEPVDEDTDPVDENETPVDENSDPVDENETPVEESKGLFDITAIRDLIFKNINEHRAAHGVEALVYAPWLQEGSTTRAQEMADYGNVQYIDENGTRHAHKRPDGSSFFTAFEDIPNSQAYGENIFGSYVSNNGEETKEDITQQIGNGNVETLKQSPGHNAGMLNDQYRSIAIGIGLKEETLDDFNNGVVDENGFNPMQYYVITHNFSMRDTEPAADEEGPNVYTFSATQAVAEEAPVAETIVEEVPAVETQEAPVVETVVEEAPAVETQEAPVVETVVEEVPAVETQEAPVVETVVEEVPAVETQEAPVVETVVEEVPAVETQEAPAVETVVEEAPAIETQEVPMIQTIAE